MGTLKHQGYEGTAELDIGRGICRGRILFIADMVTYQADSPQELQREFEVAVEDYVATCVALGKEPQ